MILISIDRHWALIEGVLCYKANAKINKDYPFIALHRMVNPSKELVS